MKIRLHETINSLGVVVGLVLSIYATLVTHEERREDEAARHENLIVSADLTDDHVGVNCDKENNPATRCSIRPTWKVIVENGSATPASIIAMRLVIHHTSLVVHHAAERSNFIDAKSVTSSSSVIPLNIPAHSSASFAFSLFIPLTDWEAREYSCFQNPDRKVCAVGYENLRVDQPAPRAEAQLFSATGREYLVPLRMP